MGGGVIILQYWWRTDVVPWQLEPLGLHSEKGLSEGCLQLQLATTVLGGGFNLKAIVQKGIYTGQAVIHNLMSRFTSLTSCQSSLS